MKKRQHGFTLIELLVVISIISLLSTIVLSSLAVARSKARDSERIQEVFQLRNALQLYFNTTGSYPTRNSVAFNSSSGPTNTMTTVLGTGVLTPTHIPTIPSPPGATYYGYVSTGTLNSGVSCNNTDVALFPFVIFYNTENVQNGKPPASGASFSPPAGSTTNFNYCLTLN